MDLLKLLAGITWIYILSVGVALSKCPGMKSLKEISGNVTTQRLFRNDDECTWNFVRRFTTPLIKINVTYFMVEKVGQCRTNQKGYLLLPGANQFCEPVTGSSTKCFYFYEDGKLCAAQMIANGECEERQITDRFSMEYHNGENYPDSGINFNYQMINCNAEVNSQCFGQTITNASGTIQPPNNGKEYGKPANCSWNLNPPSDKRYILTLKVTKLRNFFLYNNKRICPGSYNLAINGKQMDCKRYVPKTNTTRSFCHQYYSPSCRNTPISNCEVSEAASFPINVTYFSDGRLDGISSQTLSDYMGFVIEYNYTQCPDKTTTTGEPSQNKEGRSSTAAEPQNQNSTALIAGVVGGGVFLLLLAIVFIVCVKRNKNGGKANNVEDELELTQQKQQQQDASVALSPAETYDVLQRGATPTNNTTYSTVGGATSINDTTTAMYATIGENNASTPNSNYETVGGPGAEGVDMSITEGVTTSITNPDTVYSAV